MQRDPVASIVRELARADRDAPTTGQCYVLAHYGCLVLRGLGERPILQAGTAWWRRVPADQETVEEDTHFGYLWQDDAGARQLQQGIPPELHVWIGLPDRNEIVDFSTFAIPELCLRQAGLTWQMPPLPDYIWLPVSELSRDVYYRPERSATVVAISSLLTNYDLPYVPGNPRLELRDGRPVVVTTEGAG